jgi:hypothetical protein
MASSRAGGASQNNLRGKGNEATTTDEVEQAVAGLRDAGRHAGFEGAGTGAGGAGFGSGAVQVMHRGEGASTVMKAAGHIGPHASDADKCEGGIHRES